MLKKVSYLILGFILMFSFYDEVFGADQYCDMGKDKYEQLCGENPIAVYRNTAINSSGSCSGGSDGSKCGGEIKTTVNMVTSQELKEKGSNVIFNEACNCEDEEEGYHVLVMVDSSNSMELGNKFADVREAVKKIVNKYEGSSKNNVLQICYFNGNCTDPYKLYRPNGRNDLEDYIKSMDGEEKTNTNYIKALNKTRDVLKNTSKIPIVYFLTDGYPTELSNEGSVVDELGWLSTARYAYKTLKRMDSFKNQLKNDGNKNNGTNIYRYANAKFYTWGINIKAQDSFAKYILEPSNANFNNLGNGTVSSGEAKKLKSYLSGTTSGYEIVMGVASYPDRGLVTGEAKDTVTLEKDDCTKRTDVCTKYYKCRCERKNGKNNNYACGDPGDPREDNCKAGTVQRYTKCKTWTHPCVESERTYVHKHRVVFTPNATEDGVSPTFPFFFFNCAENKKCALYQNPKTGLMFFVKGLTADEIKGIKVQYKNPGGSFTDIPSNSGYWDQLTGIGYKYGPGKDDGYKVYIVKADFFFENPKATYRFAWENTRKCTVRNGDTSACNDAATAHPYAKMDSDTGISGLSESQLRDVVDGSYIGGIDYFSVVTPTLDKSPNPNWYDEVDVTTAQHTNAINREVNVSGFKIRNSNGSFSPVTLTVPIVITQSTNFTPSNSLKSGSIEVQSGRGFSLNKDGIESSPSVTNTIAWYYQEFANYGNGVASNPIVKVGNKKYTLSELYNGSNVALNINELDSAVWNAIVNSGTILNTSNTVAEMFTIFDSNDKNKNTTMNTIVTREPSSESSSSGFICNSNRGGCNSKYTVMYTITQPETRIDPTTAFVSYGPFDSPISDYRAGKNHYYVPEDYVPDGDKVLRPYKITINGINLSSVSGVTAIFNNECLIKIFGNINNPPDDPDDPNDPGTTYSYRYIDINNPFPKADNKYSLIPENWQDWYCSSHNGDRCDVNESNQKRLSNSFNKLYYSIDLSENNVIDIAKDTNNSGGYNVLGDSSTRGMEASGISDFVRDRFSFRQSDGKSYCRLGEFDRNRCDLYG